jgi:hypothetical protein
VDTGEPPSQEATAAVGARGAIQARDDGDPAEQPASPARLAFASFLMLFVELALIRWVGANNVFVNNATNFVLLASFLGIGIGFLNARTERDYVRWTPVALLALVAFVLAFPVVVATLNGPNPYHGRGSMNALPQPLSLTIVFVLVVPVMAGLGQAVARTFVRFQPLNAYRLDILGSIAGIVAFSVLSFLNQPPALWGLVALCPKEPGTSMPSRSIRCCCSVLARRIRVIRTAAAGSACTSMTAVPIWKTRISDTT